VRIEIHEIFFSHILRNFHKIMSIKFFEILLSFKFVWQIFTKFVNIKIYLVYILYFSRNKLIYFRDLQLKAYNLKNLLKIGIPRQNCRGGGGRLHYSDCQTADPLDIVSIRYRTDMN
jgi:hypothetical protein